MGKDPKSPAPPLYDCDRCLHGFKADGATIGPYTSQQRQAMHCGWIPDTEWTYPIQLPCRVIGGKADLGIDGVEWTEDVCPGWAVRQPMIEEIAQAGQAADKGNLASMFPDLAECVAEGIQELQLARMHHDRLAQAEREERIEKSKG